MQNNATRDLIVGIFVLVGLGALAYLSLQVGGLEFGGSDKIVLKATFDDIGGLSVRAPVRIAGVKVGQVSAIDLDDELRATVYLEVESDLAGRLDLLKWVMVLIGMSLAVTQTVPITFGWWLLQADSSPGENTGDTLVVET